ncbi:MAG: hypothetical protein K6G15_09985 [Desulfovibrio sp.]|nr:hypothetical protein [Desulfovibrio sp.]
MSRTPLPKPKPEEIENFPFDVKGAFVRRVGAYVYVAITYTKVDENGKKLSRCHDIGRVVDNKYYPMEEFWRTFMRGGKRREKPSDVVVRAYTKLAPGTVRRPKPKYQEGLPDPATIENYPHDVPGARILRNGKILYVVVTTYYRTNGSNRHVHQYLGKIRDGRFYTMEEYRQFDTRGRRPAKKEEEQA